MTISVHNNKISLRISYAVTIGDNYIIIFMLMRRYHVTERDWPEQSLLAFCSTVLILLIIRNSIIFSNKNDCIVVMSDDDYRIYPKKQFVQLSKTFTIHCISSTILIWTHNGNIHKDIIINDTILVVNARHSDSGIYTCEGTTSEGRVFKASCNVIVFGKLLK